MHTVQEGFSQLLGRIERLENQPLIISPYLAEDLDFIPQLVPERFLECRSVYRYLKACLAKIPSELSIDVAT